ncbi:MAG TPA: hypothetical protein VJ464_11315 [Blastocatellia bacterium]|nr:hypothetical protein [Blastocatellia bacterium]
MKTKHVAIITLLIIANLAVIGWLLNHQRASHPQSQIIPVYDSGHLPALDLYDDQGQTISTNKLKGTPLFIQFIDAKINLQVDSFIHTLANGPKSSLVWLLITDSANVLRSRLPDTNVTIVEKDYEALRSLFGVQPGIGKWFIFDGAGKLKAQGRYDIGDAAGQLRSLLDGEPAYSASVFLATLNSLNERNELSDLQVKRDRASSSKAVFVMFSAVCTGCGEAFLLELIDSYAKRYPQVWFQVLLPNPYSQRDVDNFKANLNLRVPVGVANAELSRAWLALCDKYGEKVVNGTVIAIDKQNSVSVANGLSDTKHLLQQFAGAL